MEAHGRAWLSDNICSFSPWVSNNRQIHSTKKEEPRGSLTTPPLCCSSRGQSVHSQHSSGPLVGDVFLLFCCSPPIVEHPVGVVALVPCTSLAVGCGNGPWVHLGHQTSPTVCFQNTSSLSCYLLCQRTVMQTSILLFSPGRSPPIF